MCTCCSAGCKEEFKCTNFLLTYSNPELFVKAQWNCCGCSVFYLVYRLVVAVGFIIMILKEGVEFDDGVLWFIYLTHWSFAIITIDVIVQFALTAFGYYKYRKTDEIWAQTFQYMPWYLKMEWVITNIATAAALVVTIVYWALLYDGGYIRVNNFNVHAMNSIYVFINLWITGVPVRIYHVYHAWIVFLIYVIFTAIYQGGAGQPAVYGVLDWESPGSAAAAGLVFALGGTTVVWLVYYGMYRLRLVISECVEDRGNSVVPEPDDKVYVGHCNTAYMEDTF